MEHLQSLRESINLPSHFILQVSHADDVLKDLVLLVLEVLIQALDVCEGVLHLDIYLAHTFREGLMLGFNLSDCHVEDFGRCTSATFIAPRTTDRLHKGHPVKLRCELLAHVLNASFNILESLIYGLVIGGSIFVDFSGG